METDHKIEKHVKNVDRKYWLFYFIVGSYFPMQNLNEIINIRKSFSVIYIHKIMLFIIPPHMLIISNVILTCERN
ncbi:hypothetical protein ATB99_13525 [Elizabethkingia meningoseptica]|nr:hypothetical protein BBD33_16110 [Elizabethkingia meningoseptica]EOR28433.1 hypothetical protein L100_16390 [Elizabethkingia meningoseptica ATCC 13253 = NBRC 12535]AQX48733.1 hypothetical protein B5G46_16105 [Elizabethkingia meningoseptica]KUY13805.1 hypothetical protein ATB99_13525 [Elizabethkingia meningoseptica]OPB76435.1 hypothetical protein BAY30_15600 [Elizabethkingia meningoseptica]